MGSGGDSQFTSNWSKMKAAGVLRGAYQFFEPGDDIAAQANLMIQAVGVLGDGDLPCMIDVEVTGGQSGATMRGHRAVDDARRSGDGQSSRSSIRDRIFGRTTSARLRSVRRRYGLPITVRAVRSFHRAGRIGRCGNTAMATARSITTSSMERSRICRSSRRRPVRNIQPSFIAARPTSTETARATSARARRPAWFAKYRRRVERRRKSTVPRGVTPAAGTIHNIIGRSSSPTSMATAKVICARETRKASCARSPRATRSARRSAARNGAMTAVGRTFNITRRSNSADVDGDGKADVCARAAAGIICELSSGAEFPTAVTGPAWSDANGWANPQYYNTIQFVDMDGDGKADVCGRAAAGVVCELSDGKSFPTEIQGPAWSDAEGWAAPEYESTIRFADIDGDGKVDVCGRSAAGIVCSKFDGKAIRQRDRGASVVGRERVERAAIFHDDSIRRHRRKRQSRSVRARVGRRRVRALGRKWFSNGGRRSDVELRGRLG